MSVNEHSRYARADHSFSADLIDAVHEAICQRDAARSVAMKHYRDPQSLDDASALNETQAMVGLRRALAALRREWALEAQPEASEQLTRSAHYRARRQEAYT